MLFKMFPDAHAFLSAIQPGCTLTMMAESLPFSTETPVPSWELEAWYEDLQEVLSSDVTIRAGPPVGGEQQEFDGPDSSALLWSLEASNPLEASSGEAAGNCELDLDLTAELLELLGEEPAGAAESDCSHSSPAQTGTDDEEGVSSSRKRKWSGQPQGSKRQRGREREQENERRVAELTAHNQRLQQEIERLSTEVEATRAALIQRMVNLKT
ncbi:DNA damage-inducible transcript 3 protein isoform X2 [Eublepharis macularius]|uniref:DNA damage-inducible transcript 3 protein n=1 Tax=Eublepharis macularius TaxID=481883 RepID=A0AA97KL72_EUBMA|nr:DNA damage-inducible transcript 3 protein isoform X2 [Eublepharis macularius]